MHSYFTHTALAVQLALPDFRFYMGLLQGESRALEVCANLTNTWTRLNYQEA